MIKFEAKVKVLSVEKKTLKTSSGNDFSFTEVLVVDMDERRPTKMTTRLGSFVEEGAVHPGQELDAVFLIMSNEGRDGRIWNNFILSSIKEIPKDIPTIVNQIGKEKTNEDVLNEAQAFMDDLPF